VSGPAPETERERQLRQLATRLLSWPDPDGPVTVELIPLGFPDDLPPGLVDATELRFLGSVVRRRGHTLAGTELVFEAGDEPETVLSTYEAQLVAQGWERLERHGPMRSGFQPFGLGDMSMLSDKEKTVVLNLHATDREGGGSVLRVRYDAGGAAGVMARAERGIPYEASLLPQLKPPPGVRMWPEGGGGGPGQWTSNARAETEMAPMELEPHFAKQLEAAGWGRTTGSADDTFAWSGWTIPDSGDGHGLLLVVADLPGVRTLLVRVESTQGHRRSGFAVSGLRRLY
jgi:hypothetical protein